MISATTFAREFRSGWHIKVIVVVLVAMSVFVIAMPTKLVVGQQADIADARAELGELRGENDALEAKLIDSSAPASIEEVARSDYGWGYVGEETYTVPDSPPPLIVMPDVWPFSRVEDALIDAANE